MQKQKGFTIVELLIVIVVIAILAAITVVSYTGISNRAHDTAVQSDLRNIAQKFEFYKYKNEYYPVGNAQIQDSGIKVSTGSYGPGFAGLHNLLYCRIAASGPTEYALMAESKSGKVFIYRSVTGAITSTGAWYSTGSNGNCSHPNVGINQVLGTDRDLLKYNGTWEPWL